MAFLLRNPAKSNTDVRVTNNLDFILKGVNIVGILPESQDIIISRQSNLLENASFLLA